MSAVSQLGYLGLTVSDPEAWKDLATNVLGFQVLKGDHKLTSYMRMDDYHHRFLVHPGDDDLAYIGWEVPDDATLKTVAERAEKAGIRVTPGSRDEADERRVLDLIKMEDPAGVPIEVFYGPLLDEPRFVPTRPISGFKAGAQGLGHLVVYQRDLEESIAFYRDVLGLRISDYVHLKSRQGKMSVVFFHCNPRHHSIAFVATPPLPRRINHFMVELSSLDDVGTGYDLCQKSDVPIAVQLGRHANDAMFSFYLSNPSNFMIEYGWGAKEVDDSNWAVQHFTAASRWGHKGLLEGIGAES